MAVTNEWPQPGETWGRSGLRLPGDLSGHMWVLHCFRSKRGTNKSNTTERWRSQTCGPDPGRARGKVQLVLPGAKLGSPEQEELRFGSLPGCPILLGALPHSCTGSQLPSAPSSAHTQRLPLSSSWGPARDGPSHCSQGVPKH